MSAAVAHEAVGHGGACLLTGGRIELLTSVYFRCVPGAPLIDAAGPLLNLLVALAAFFALKHLKVSGVSAACLALILGFNALWGAGYFIFSAVTNSGDWAFVLRDVAARPLWAWRLVIGGVGVVTYGATLAYLARCFPRGSPLVCAYLAAGAVACFSVTLYDGPVMPALREAAQESLLASVGLVYIALARRTLSFDAHVIAVGHPGRVLVAFVSCALAVFLATLGRGYGGAS